MNTIMRRVGFEIIDTGFVSNKWWYEMFEMLVQVFIVLFDIFEFCYDPFTHYKFQNYKSSQTETNKK